MKLQLKWKKASNGDVIADICGLGSIIIADNPDDDKLFTVWYNFMDISDCYDQVHVKNIDGAKNEAEHRAQAMLINGFRNFNQLKNILNK